MERIYHTWDAWECYPAGFYEVRAPKALGDIDCEESYRTFLSDDDAFRAALGRVLAEWPNSCEHYLSNENMNRIAWLGQASMCIATGIPSRFRGGFYKLTEAQQARANATALEYLNRWLVSRGEPELAPEAAQSKTEMNLY